MARKYWLNLFTGTTWTEFLSAGATVSGFRDARWSTVKLLQPGDYFLCYLTGVSRWIGVLEVTGAPYQDYEKKIWNIDAFPARVPVRVVMQLEPVYGVPILSMRDRLSMFQNASSPHAWTAA